ncbi:MAG: hypothetical protein RIB59_12445 [Rhodospirillales bacterium]
MTPIAGKRGEDLNEAIDFDTPKGVNLAAVARRLDSALNRKVARLIERQPDRSLAVIRRWLNQ